MLATTRNILILWQASLMCFLLQHLILQTQYVSGPLNMTSGPEWTFFTFMGVLKRNSLECVFNFFKYLNIKNFIDMQCCENALSQSVKRVHIV